MASLPSHHPHLALHLADRALTPIISSASSSSTTTSSSKPYLSKQQLQHSKRSPHPNPTFSTSPPSSSDDDDDDDSEEEEEEEEQNETSQALSHLTSTALASYDAAKRLERGAPLRTIVEYSGPDSPVVLHSYMCPMSLALGVPGRKGSNESLRTGAGGALPAASSEDDGESRGGGGEGAAEGGGAAKGSNDNGEAPPANQLSKLALRDLRDIDSDDGDEGDHHHIGGTDGSQDSPNAPPMLIGTVVAPKADDLRDARRAAGRLERVARVFQTEWLTVEGTGDAGAGT